MYVILAWDQAWIGVMYFKLIIKKNYNNTVIMQVYNFSGYHNSTYEQHR